MIDEVRDKKKLLNRIYFKNRVLLDSGANISATSQEESISQVERNRDITVNGSTGKYLSNTIGVSKVFGTLSVLLKDLKFDIYVYRQEMCVRCEKDKNQYVLHI